MKSQLVRVNDHGKFYSCLMFVCPGCATGFGTGLHMLPVNVQAGYDIGHPSWSFDGNLEYPTVSPSILTHRVVNKVGKQVHPRCHSFLKAGVFQFLEDSTHPLVGQFVPIPDLYDWAVN